MSYLIKRSCVTRGSIWLFALVLFGPGTRAQGITGVWNGALHVQPKDIPIVFHIARDSSGKLIATFDSPSQNAFNLPVSEVITKSDSVILLIAMLNGKYAGLLGGDARTIEGRWFQGGGSLPLTVTKTSDSSTVRELRRPQTPKPPFPYQTKEVEYWNADKTIRFGGTLTYPGGDEGEAGQRRFPAILLITGSGQQDRDETLFGHKPFAVIADHLTRHGFLVLRVDDRGMGTTTGDFSQATTLDFAKDVEAGLDFLESLPEVDKAKIGLLGHSEGGMIAPMVADARKEVKFIVLLAGPGEPCGQLLVQQSEAVSISQGMAPADAKAGSELVRIAVEEINKNLDSASTVNHIRSRVVDWAKTVDSVTLAKIRARNSGSMDEVIVQTMKTMGSTWFRYFIAFDPRPYLEKLSCKVLALNGSKDVQVVAGPNLAGMRAALKKSHAQEYEVIELPGLNHLFQTCASCSPAEYGELEETFSPKVLEVIDQWLAKNVQ
jgi:pimeloyl-ACP methyl ester carboxylesterase